MELASAWREPTRYPPPPPADQRHQTERRCRRPPHGVVAVVVESVGWKAAVMIGWHVASAATTAGSVSSRPSCSIIRAVGSNPAPPGPLAPPGPTVRRRTAVGRRSAEAATAMSCHRRPGSSRRLRGRRHRCLRRAART